MKTRLINLSTIVITTIALSLFAVSCEKDEIKQGRPDDAGIPDHAKIPDHVNLPDAAGVNTIKDIDGNVYPIVKIGEQWWMAENLKVSRYCNGDDIPTDLDNTEWQTAEDGAFAVYAHSDIDGLNSNQEVLEAYGALYNWNAVDDSRGLCPTGWRVPSPDDWTELIVYLGGVPVAGGKLKSTRTEPDDHPRWDSPNKDATNEYGFSALPGGIKSYYGNLGYIGSNGYWWSSYGYDNTAHAPSMTNSSSFMYLAAHHKVNGLSVRCVRD